MKNAFVINGTFVHAPRFSEVESFENSCALIEEGCVVEIQDCLKSDWKGLPLVEVPDRLILPAYFDIHLHAVQYVNRGLGHDKGLLDWLSTYTFPEEARFDDLDYARFVFSDLIQELWQGGSLFSSLYSSANLQTAELLMQLLDQAGLHAFVGKTNMDRLADPVTENSGRSLRETRSFAGQGTARVRPILTPRFAPSCTPELMRGLGDLAREMDLPVQTHINETESEVHWVAELFPEARDYLDAYEQAGLLRPGKTILAHAIYNTPRERQAFRELDLLLAHCPSSNTNLTSGVMPVRELAQDGIRIGLGSDISGGEALFMNRVMADAIKASKLLAVLQREPACALNEAEVLHLATAGGAPLFGETGTFAVGSRFNALVIDDRRHTRYRPLTPLERLQKWIYLGLPEQIESRYLHGAVVGEPGVTV